MRTIRKYTFEDRFDRKYACWVKNAPKAWAKCKRGNRRKTRRVLSSMMRKELEGENDV